MKFEIEADIPEGYEAIAYRNPYRGEWIAANEGPRPAHEYDVSEPWLILREKTLAYEEFAVHYTDALEAFVDRNDGDITLRIANAEAYLRTEAAKSLRDWLTAAADHVDRVNKQKGSAA